MSHTFQMGIITRLQILSFKNVLKVTQATKHSNLRGLKFSKRFRMFKCQKTKHWTEQKNISCEIHSFVSKSKIDSLTLFQSELSSPSFESHRLPCHPLEFTDFIYISACFDYLELFNFELFWLKVTVHKHQISCSKTV